MLNLAGWLAQTQWVSHCVGGFILTCTSGLYYSGFLFKNIQVKANLGKKNYIFPLNCSITTTVGYSYIRRAGVSVNLSNSVWKIFLQSQGPACNRDAPGSQSELAGVCFGGQKEDTGRRATSRLPESQTAAGASGWSRCLSLSLLILCQQSSLAELSQISRRQN